MAEAYVRASPVYSVLFTDLRSFIAENREHFVAGGDAVRCADALAREFLSVRTADYFAMRPTEGERWTTSGQLYGLGLELTRLARVLPAAAQGDFDPLKTPANESEAMRLQAGAAFQAGWASDPQQRARLEPSIKHAADVDRQVLRSAAAQLEINHIVALLDTSTRVRGDSGRERAFMMKAALAVGDFPDDVRAPGLITSVDDAARALEGTLRFYGKALAKVISNPAGTEWQARFRRVYAVEGNEFTVTAGDSAQVDPASYDVACRRRGSRPLQADRYQCYSVCHVVCQATRKVP